MMRTSRIASFLNESRSNETQSIAITGLQFMKAAINLHEIEPN